ncbi:MAG: helix-turn-helix domain-containing protein [Planctomycetota bacterium]
MATELLSARQLADHIGVSTGTILGWVEQRGLPSIRLSKRTIRFDPVAVEHWLREHHAEPPASTPCGTDGNRHGSKQQVPGA